MTAAEVESGSRARESCCRPGALPHRRVKPAGARAADNGREYVAADTSQAGEHKGCRRRARKKKRSLEKPLCMTRKRSILGPWSAGDLGICRACGVSQTFERGYFEVPLLFQAADVPRFIPYALNRIFCAKFSFCCILHCKQANSSIIPLVRNNQNLPSPGWPAAKRLPARGRVAVRRQSNPRKPLVSSWSEVYRHRVRILLRTASATFAIDKSARMTVITCPALLQRPIYAEHRERVAE